MRVIDLINEYHTKVAKKRTKVQNTKVFDAVEEFSEYLKQVEMLTDVIDEISIELMNLASNPCKQNRTFWFWAALLHPSRNYFPPLSKLLENNSECIWHEAIVEIFQILKDERAIPSLEKALHHNLNYDPFQAVAIRTLEALAEIGTPDAVKVLEDCLQSSSYKIREEAQLLLEDF